MAYIDQASLKCMEIQLPVSPKCQKAYSITFTMEIISDKYFSLNFTRYLCFLKCKYLSQKNGVQTFFFRELRQITPLSTLQKWFSFGHLQNYSVSMQLRNQDRQYFSLVLFQDWIQKYLHHVRCITLQGCSEWQR